MVRHHARFTSAAGDFRADFLNGTPLRPFVGATPTVIIGLERNVQVLGSAPPAEDVQVSGPQRRRRSGVARMKHASDTESPAGTA